MKNTLLLITTLFIGSAALANKITEKNWQKNAEVIEVRKIYDANQKLKKGWIKQDKVWNYCEPYADTQRILITDKKGIARIYSNSGGSDDSSVNWESHYDENGKLRFVFITGGAANGSKLEHRIYFRANGDRFWELQKYVEGPGYTFPNPWPHDQLTTDPIAAYKAPHPCAK